MNAQHFLRHIERAMPSRASMQEYGLDNEEIEEMRSTFLAPRRPVSIADGLSQIEQLIVGFDCSKLEVGLVRFNGRLVPHRAGTCFAYCEADPLVLVEDGSVWLCDHVQPDSVFQPCAESADRFLDAMATFASIRSDGESWMGRTGEAVDLCATAAGGERFADFFRLL